MTFIDLLQRTENNTMTRESVENLVQVVLLVYIFSQVTNTERSVQVFYTVK